MLNQLFTRIQPAKIIENQLHEANIKALEYEASAEYYAALAKMYRDRIDRLGRESVGTSNSS